MSGARLPFVLPAVSRPSIPFRSVSCIISTAHTQIGKSVVEPPPSVIEALVCDSQPFGLLVQHLVTARAQQLDVCVVQPLGVLVDLENTASRSRPYPEGRLHARWCLLPSRSVGGLGVVPGCSRWGGGREGARGGPHQGRPGGVGAAQQRGGGGEQASGRPFGCHCGLCVVGGGEGEMRRQWRAEGTLRCVLDVDAHVRKVAASGRIAPSPKPTSLSRDFSTPDSTRNSRSADCVW